MTNIVKVLGGLGNQMFQYVLFKQFKKRGIPVKLDIGDFDNYTLHNGLELSGVFGIDLEDDIATPKQIDQLKDKGKLFKIRKIIGKVLFNNPNKFINGNHFIEPNFSGYDPNIYDLKNKYLEGYWQNEKYFLDDRENVISLFSWSDVSDQNMDLSKKMLNENSVAVHIRRLDQPKTIRELIYRIRLSFVWRTCSKSYYLNSIMKMREEVENPKFYIFTDNIPWVKRNMQLDDSYIIVDWNRGENSYQDMYLMSKCKHNIISMSSFSWWGAWLNRNPKKTIIAPKKWAVRFSSNVDIIPNNWMKI